jgi:glycosyltransferase involved in cell wall biosynthesis
MEVRKNIWKIAQVWDRLRKVSNVDLPRLVFAGKVGWLTQDFDGFMKSTGNLYGWIDIFDKPTDDELSFLYRNCLFTITASFYEGWGLPIGEGLSYGKTAVVSETSSMPEVGGSLVEYCNPKSIDSILNACLKLIENPSYRENLEKKIEQTSLRSWKDVAQDLIIAIASESEIQSSMVSSTQNNDENLTEIPKFLNVVPLKGMKSRSQ